jgi:acyl-CoA synthetase (NDP forming)/GNAT superfamily N-acetyltransferase
VIALDSRHYAADELLRDGGSIHIRSIRREDKRELLEHFRRLSFDSVYFRFFGPKNDLSERELGELTELDFIRRAALVATLVEHGTERIVGVGRYIAIDPAGEPPTRAEVAFAVADEHQGRGIGSLLLAHLLPLARAAGIQELEADVMGENRRMLEVFAASGFVIRHSLAGGVVHVTFATEETQRAREAREARARLAAARSLRPFLDPRSIAIVGASRRPGALGSALLRNLKAAGFAGRLHPVNPHASSLEGLVAHSSLSAIGGPVDLAVVAVRASLVEEVVRECAAAGVRAVVVVSAGFGERSEEGRRVEARLRRLVRRSGMRLVGPNAMGVLNTDADVRLNATLASVLPPAGNIGMLTQSGALGLTLIDQARRRQLGISSFVAVGNKADVSGNDLLCYWSSDARTSVIALYLESFGNPRRFARLASEVSRHKPIVAIKSGRSGTGRRAASGHTAAVACPDAAVAALFEQAGVIRADTLEELFDVAALLSTQPVPSGNRVGLVTNAGGAATLFADACEAAGLSMPPLCAATRRALRAFLPEAGLDNPVDLLESGSPREYERAVQALGAEDGVDAVVVIHAALGGAGQDAVCAAIARGAAAVPEHKPVLVVLLSSVCAPVSLASGRRGRLPSYAYPESAARALGRAAWYGRWRERPRGTLLELEADARQAARAAVAEAGPALAAGGWLAPDAVAALLEAASIGFEPGAKTAPDALEARVAVSGDPAFGPLVLCGLGGAVAKLARDISFRLPPLSDLDAAEMIERLRLRPLLDGHADAPAADRAALVDVLMRVSALLEAVPEIEQLELEPIELLAPGCGAVVRGARIRVQGAELEPDHACGPSAAAGSGSGGSSSAST